MLEKPHLYNIFNNLNDIIWSISWPELEVKFVSRAVEDIIGYSAAEFKADPELFQKITHPEDRKINEQALKEFAEKGYSEREIRVIAKDGSVKWINDKAKMFYDQEGNPARLEGVMRDITQRKKAEERLKYNRERYKTIFKSAPIGILIEDAAGKIVETNQKLCEMSGYSKEELEGSSVLDKFVQPEYFELAKENIKKIIGGQDMQFDIKTPTKNGDMIYKFLKETNIVLPGGEKGIISMHLDITERKEIEQELKEKNILLKSILESIQDGIAVLNPDLTIRYTNPTMDTWYKKGKPFENQKCYQAYYNQEQSCEDCPVLKSLNSKKMESAVKKLPKSHELDYIEIYSYPILDEENEVNGVVEFVRDISENLKRQRELKMTNFSINKADLMIFRVTPEGIIEYANETTLDKLGYRRSELIGQEVKDVVVLEDYIEREKFWNKIKSQKSIIYEKLLISKNGKTFPVEITSQYFKYENKEYEFAFVQDITERKEKEEEIKYLLYRDSLTGLYNRRFFEEEVRRLDTSKQLPISIITGDLNGLKIINDTYGHKKGDQMLIKTAGILKKVLRSEDILARHGGDEFTILLPQTANDQAEKIVERIKEEAKKTTIAAIPISIGLGTAAKTESSQNIWDILQQADNNMYKNKLSESRSSKSNIVQGLINVLDAKSSETKEHAVRMTKLAFEFGEKLELSNSEQNRLSLLATLHDIGKTNISEEILNKMGKLTKKEWEIMKNHSEQGYKIATSSEEFASVSEEILTHHEHWDGRGYPENIKGEEIPFLARIISIIDAFDVMTHDRPYSKAVSREEALKEIKSCSGSQFDPELAAEFIKMFE
ncbi:MAG: PAS domain S-box protein [Halanaerobium sp.]